MPADNNIPAVSVATFIATVFEGRGNDELVCLSQASQGWLNVAASDRWLAKLDTKPGQGAWYFCVSTIRRPQGDYLARAKEDLRFAYCLVLDDIGTKAKVPPVAPSWILESSEGNFQYGYLIDPIEMTPDAQENYDACVRGLALAGYSDPGARGAWRIMRIPGSLHKTGFIARVVDWYPERTWDLEDLMAEMGVEPLAHHLPGLGRPRIDSRGVSLLEELEDPILDWLQAQGLVRGISPKWVEIVCPWHTEHSSGSDTAGYSPPWYNDRARSFSCLHTHTYTITDFLRWVAEKGGPVITQPPPMPKALARIIEANKHG